MLRGFGKPSGLLLDSTATPYSNLACFSGGVLGMLRGFGKRAVKAAQASLATVEAALERMDQVEIWCDLYI